MFKINKKVLAGSLILFIAFNIYNALNFFFHFSMARMLTIEDYGVLATLYSFIYILSIFTESVQTVIMRYTAKEKDKGKIKNILKRSFSKAIIISAILFILYLIASIPLSNVLGIDYLLLALNGLMITEAFFIPINRGILQGKKMFTKLGASMILEAVVKLIVSIILVYMGWRVYGAIAGTIIAVSLVLVYSFIQLRDILKSKEKKAKTSEIYSYTKPTFFIMFSILLFFSIDILIAKIVFSSTLAGFYALASTLGKTIFLGTQPISRAMFPLSAENESKSKKSESVFRSSRILLFLVLSLSLLVFFFFPEYLIRIFSGKFVPEAAQILFFVGLGMGILSLTNLNILYKLSQGRVKGYAYLLIFVAIEIVLLSLFSASLIQFSIAFLASSLIFLIGSFIFPR